MQIFKVFVVVYLHNSKESFFSVFFFFFRAYIWMERCGIEKKYTGFTMVCEAHFHTDMIELSGRSKWLRKDAVPTLNLPPSPLKRPIPRDSTITEFKIISKAKQKGIRLNPINYNNFMENIIVKSLNISPQINLPTDTSFTGLSANTKSFEIESMGVESSSIEMNKKHMENSDGNLIKKPTINTHKSLPDKHYALKTIAELKKKIFLISRYPDTFKMASVKIHLECPQGYQMLHKTLQLPPVSKLRTILDDWTISTDNGTMFASILEYKLKLMSEDQKECMLCIGSIDISKDLYYDIKRDKFIGICYMNNTQKPELAYKVLVLTVQGIYTNWKQPIDIAYLSSPKNDNVQFIDQWLARNISNLLTIGFKVRAIVCETDYLLRNSSPQHELYSKIYYMYDVMSLLKWFFYIFLTHDFIFGDEKAKIQHIYDYIELDSKNKPRLTPNITEETLKPASMQDLNVKDVMKIISMETAAAMTIYINLKVLKPAAKNTVQMITKMSKLYEIIYSNKCDTAATETYIQVLLDMLSYFDSLKIVNSLTKKEVAAEDTFVPKFQLTIHAILLLNETMQCKDKVKFLSTRRLSLENTNSFFDRIKQLNGENTKLTCKRVYFAFIQSALINILRSPLDKKREMSLEVILYEIKKNLVTQSNRPHSDKITLYVQIKCSEYNTLDFKNKDSIILLAGFLLKKCYDRHTDCNDMKNYIFIVLQDTNSICKTILREIQESICVVPQESFIEFVEMMEIKFRCLMTKDIFQSRDGFVNGLLKAMKSVTFAMPCLCFPTDYAKELFLRVRIYNMLKYNNSYSAAFPDRCKYLVVNNL